MCSNGSEWKSLDSGPLLVLLSFVTLYTYAHAPLFA